MLVFPILGFSSLLTDFWLILKVFLFSVTKIHPICFLSSSYFLPVASRAFTPAIIIFLCVCLHIDWELEMCLALLEYHFPSVETARIVTASLFALWSQTPWLFCVFVLPFFISWLAPFIQCMCPVCIPPALFIQHCEHRGF